MSQIKNARPNSSGTSGHRRSNSRNFNGSGPGSNRKYNGKEESSQKPAVQQSKVAAQNNDDRLLFALAHSIGSKVIVTVGSGSSYSGMLVSFNDFAADSELSVIVKYPELIDGSQENDAEELPETLVFKAKDIVAVEIEQLDFSKAHNSYPAAIAEAAEGNTDSKKAFKTDTDISGKSQSKERELQKWVPEGPDTDLGNLEDDTHANWDQFEVNERKFGVKSTYDENLYTTRINRDDPDYERKLVEAERIAKEIESQSYNGNIHVAEERGLVVDDSGIDEEDKYSGVLRDDDNSQNKGGELLLGMLKKNVKAQPSELKQYKAGRYVPPNHRAANFHHDPAVLQSSAITQDTTKTNKPKEGQDSKTGDSKEQPKTKAQKEIESLKEFSSNLKLPKKPAEDSVPKEKNKQETSKTPSSTSKVSDESSKPATAAATTTTKKPFKMNPNTASFSPMGFGGQTDFHAPHRIIPASGTSQASFTRPKRNISQQAFFGANRVPTVAKQKILKDNFNLFLEKHRKDPKAPFEKPFVTPPTWETTIEESYRVLFPINPEIPMMPDNRMFFYGGGQTSPIHNTSPLPQQMIPRMIPMIPGQGPSGGPGVPQTGSQHFVPYQPQLIPPQMMMSHNQQRRGYMPPLSQSGMGVPMMAPPPFPGHYNGVKHMRSDNKDLR
ncbi:hypothetical protein LJB42_000999 [Komagataella kurtzmanii]|nr:hypothetical protein LJB42_000999 [Komagataella kurtzmanii]